MSSVKEQVKMSIASAGELLKSLRHEDLAYRIALLRTIRKEPAKALSLGRANGRDVLDELLALCKETRGQAERWEYVFTALHFNDERNVGLARGEFLSAHDHRFLVMAAKRLSQLSEAEKAEFLAPVLLEGKNANRCRLCANLLAGNSLLNPRAAIRVAALSDRFCQLPPITPETLDAWIAELSGPYPGKTRALLLSRENGSVAALLTHWEKLPPRIRLWAFQEAVKKDPAEHESRIRDILRQEKDGELLSAALEAARAFSWDDGEDLIAPLYRHAEPAIRAAAIRATRTDHDWAAWLRQETSQPVRLALIDRLGRSWHSDPSALLAALLEDANWQIRAAATNALVALGPSSVTTLQKLVPHHNPAVKAAALQALVSLGQEEWLEAQLK